MPGPPPKPASQRRRRNVVKPAATLPATVRVAKAPALPRSKEMLASTRAWWKTVWASPMSAQWIAADLPNVYRLAALVDLTARQFAIVAEGPIPRLEERIEWQTEDRRTILVRFESPVQAQLLAEMRQLEDRLGLSPMARKRLQWEIPDESAPADDKPAADELAARRARFEKAAG